MLRFEITKSETSRIMKELSSRVRDLEPPLRGFGNYLGQETEKQFNSQVDPDGRPWARLAPSTLAEKRKKGYPDDILTRTGKMKRSFKVLTSSREMTATMDLPAPFHQSGTRKMPQRRIFGLNAERRRQLQRLIRVYVGGRR